MPNPPTRSDSPNASSSPGGVREAPGGPSLAVVIDGVRLPADEGRAFWARFSAYMEEHKGDLGGFAKAEGFASVRPEMIASGAALVVSRSAAQVAYTNVSAEGAGGGGESDESAMDANGSVHGSPGAQARPSPDAKRLPRPHNSSRKRR